MMATKLCGRCGTTPARVVTVLTKLETADDGRFRALSGRGRFLCVACDARSSDSDGPWEAMDADELREVEVGADLGQAYRNSDRATRLSVAAVLAGTRSGTA